MPVRAAFMMDTSGGGAGADVIAALTQGGGIAEMRVLHGGRLPLRMAVQLAAFRPDVVITAGAGVHGALAMLYRLLCPRSRVLVSLADGPDFTRSLLRRAVLAWADGVLAEGEGLHAASAPLRGPGARVFPLSGPCGLEPFLALPLTRDGAAVHRLVYAGPLSPQSGVVDIVLSLAAWAESHPARAVEIWWLGEGDLAGVLDAQPLPDNMTQRFPGAVPPEQLPGVFAQCGIMVLPLRPAPGPSPVAAAMAAGLVVIGSGRDGHARHYMDGGIGWIFDPARPDDMMEAVGSALQGTPDQLAAMRAAGRQVVRDSAAQGMADRTRAALAAILPGPNQRPGAAPSHQALEPR